MCVSSEGHLIQKTFQKKNILNVSCLINPYFIILSTVIPDTHKQVNSFVAKAQFK